MAVEFGGEVKRAAGKVIRKQTGEQHCSQKEKGKKKIERERTTDRIQAVAVRTVQHEWHATRMSTQASSFKRCHSSFVIFLKFALMLFNLSSL